MAALRTSPARSAKQVLSLISSPGSGRSVRFGGVPGRAGGSLAGGGPHYTSHTEPAVTGPGPALGSMAR